MMGNTRFSSSGYGSRKTIDVIIHMGNPFLIQIIVTFLKIAIVAAVRVAAEEGYQCFRKGSVSKHNFKQTFTKICKEGAYWGTIAAVYIVMVFLVEMFLGVSDWKNSMLAGALTGASISIYKDSSRDKVVVDAITGGAIATAAEFLN
ncbi:hypothetical protein GIB67_040476 [Kingdonia uniflora]|uniref:Uncharacterized protein n=1 Tax=Kingdonia uniflora TaxID=39325 RepID=A0A7J7L5D1_9MAGN|nr:hypothetical protein GIB67_040476 [Kingdonia uniflora]